VVVREVRALAEDEQRREARSLEKAPGAARPTRRRRRRPATVDEGLAVLDEAALAIADEYVLRRR